MRQGCCAPAKRRAIDWGFDLALFYGAEMNYESGPSSSSLGAERPDKPLVVKCEYNARQHKLTFKSARFCTYDGLREKVLPLFVIPHTLKCYLLDRRTLLPGSALLRNTMEGRLRRVELH